MKITGVEAIDIRFPTSRWAIGSDAVHTDPDYSAAYAILSTDGELEGHGFTFTIGRGTEVCVAAIEALTHHVVGVDLEEVQAAPAAFWRELTNDTQLRWLGPEKGVIHLATAALVNAVWDVWAKQAGKPLWKLLADMPPANLVDCVDFRHLTDALTPEEAVELLERADAGKSDRETALGAEGVPAYVTSVGWLGYPDDRIRELCRRALADGWTAVKMKVGQDLDDDLRRARLIREEIGPDRRLAMDANQRWEVNEAIEWVDALALHDPYWIEEPTSPDDIAGHAAIARAVDPVRVATGEHIHNRVMWKQLFAAEATGFCQLDMCRLGGVNEAIAVILLAAKHETPVCPHAGGVGLCEYHQHLAAFDRVRLGGAHGMLEFADHLHEHFIDPARTRNGHYVLPTNPGTSAEMHPASRSTYRFPYADEPPAVEPPADAT